MRRHTTAGVAHAHVRLGRALPGNRLARRLEKRSQRRLVGRVHAVEQGAPARRERVRAARDVSIANHAVAVGARADRETAQRVLGESESLDSSCIALVGRPMCAHPKSCDLLHSSRLHMDSLTQT